MLLQYSIFLQPVGGAFNDTLIVYSPHQKSVADEWQKIES